MQLLVFGLNHATAPVSIREAVSFAPEELEEALHTVCSLLASESEGGVAEAMILSTCNRTEFYLAANDADAAVAGLSRFISLRKQIREEELLPHTYLHRHLDAVRHVFRVASGLDSMVLGETQIVGQMKKAWRAAKEAGTIGLFLGHLFTERSPRQKMSGRQLPLEKTRFRWLRPACGFPNNFLVTCRRALSCLSGQGK